jgi:short-subunit dehydrogenase
MAMNQKICTIVGFGSGVSMGVAKAYSQEGYSLALIARNLDKLVENSRALAQTDINVQTFAADAGDEASLIQAFAQIRTHMGDPEVLIYNAAALTPGKPTTLAVDRLIADFRVNVAGALVAAQQVIPAMKTKAHGTILFTGGGLALYPAADVASLGIGKAGIRSLAFSLAQELAGDGIHVGTVTICGAVQPGTHFDPDKIASSYWQLHTQSQDAWQTEYVYQ